MTIVWGFFGFFMIPDYPNRPNPRAFWFNADHAALSMERLKRHHKAEPKKMTWAGAKRTFSTWPVYFVPVLYIASVLGSYGYNYFSLFLKDVKNADGTARWTTSQINAIPIAGGAINVVFVWIWAILSDYFQTRWTLILAQAGIGLIPNIIMIIWTRQPVSVGISAAYASFFISYITLGTAPLIFCTYTDFSPLLYKKSANRA